MFFCFLGKTEIEMFCLCFIFLSGEFVKECEAHEKVFRLVIVYVY